MVGKAPGIADETFGADEYIRPTETTGIPPVPKTLEETGLDEPFVLDLLLKTIYQNGATVGDRLERALRLPYPLLDDPLLTLQQRRLVEVRGTHGEGRRGYIYDLTGEGRERARELMQTAGYVGPAPVTLETYRQWMLAQSVRTARATRDQVHEGLGHLVLDPVFLDTLGPAINSGRSIFLYGNSGNGKTVIAEAIAELIGGTIFIPHAVRMDGHVVQVYDPTVHRVVEDAWDDQAYEDFQGEAGEGNNFVRAPAYHDPRFIEIERPAVIVGGELTLEQLELQHDPVTGVFRAPPQVKANGGVLVIDDFGRQRVRPRDLLNRWMYPLERHVDFLSLPTGQKLGVPFECLLIFATNLNPADLVEEAFLRRIRYKILVENPTREQYGEILKRCCEANGVEYLPATLEQIYDEYYGPLGIAPRKCHPRDLVRLVVDMAGYSGTKLAMTPEAVRWACRSYFLNASPGDERTVPESGGVSHAR
jgi:predicted ATPase with chaperone activity